MDMMVAYLNIGFYWVETAIFIALAVFGVWGMVEVIMTRDDAFEADSRMAKWNWVALLAGATFVTVVQLPYIWLAGPVIIGVYWMDVRPSIRDLLAGHRNAW